MVIKSIKIEIMELTINKQKYEVNATPDMPLLWVLRDMLNLTGTKYSCGIGLCGSCVVLADGQPVRSCMTEVSFFLGKDITTIEGLSIDGNHPLQLAWEEVDVTQCGYCQPGQILTAVALLNSNPAPTDTDIDEAMKNNLCRCGTYRRIKEAIHLAAEN
jgi:isoquinoline 1-oxidoreductase alpha subunit